jgi:restriction system protein
MARRKQSGFDLIAAAPWPIGIVLGVLAYFGVRYGFTLLGAFTGNRILAGIGNFAQNNNGYRMLAWIVLGLCWIGALGSFIRRKKRKRLLETQTGLDSLRAMSWRQFEMLVGEAFRRQGYRIEETGLGGADGGVDLLLRKDGKTTLVQCKQWRSQRVDVKVVREMYGLLAHHGAEAVKIVAVGNFTPDAQRFAQGKPIELIHGEALRAMVRGVQEAPPLGTDPPAKPAVASAATPDCPSCGAPMIKRTNRRSRESFWGCPKYPGCRGTRPV